MRIVIYTNVISAHQLPLARELVRRLGPDDFRYVYTGEADNVRQEVLSDEPWIVREDGLDEASRRGLLHECDILLVGGIRPIELMEKRLSEGRKTLYMSERWFKPVLLPLGISLPGWVKLCHPRYFRMARRFAHLFDSPAYRFLPIGPWAKKDMSLMCRLFCVKADERKVVDWGYFVSPGKSNASSGAPRQNPVSGNTLRVLWVGRLLGWKRVDDIIRAAGAYADLKQKDDSIPKMTLDIYGDGPEKTKLVRMVGKRRLEGIVTFHPPVSIEEVRELMHNHDVYVLASNSFEGWGAVVSEAMTEGMAVIGTFEAGASATLLPESNLFRCGDWRRLSRLLAHLPQKISLPYEYTPKGAAERLLEL